MCMYSTFLYPYIGIDPRSNDLRDRGRLTKKSFFHTFLRGTTDICLHFVKNVKTGFFSIGAAYTGCGLYCYDIPLYNNQNLPVRKNGPLNKYEHLKACLMSLRFNLGNFLSLKNKVVLTIPNMKWNIILIQNKKKCRKL
jgi:hypothetical protein